MQSELRNKSLGGVYMHVIIGKTVEAFKVNSNVYLSQGKAGAAILENEDQTRYDLYIYRDDQMKITSARIASRFQFEIHINLYCSFYDNAGVPWAIRFNQEADAIDFVKEVALARWKSGPLTDRVLFQEVRHGDPSLLCKPDSLVAARYSAAVLNAENKFTPEMEGCISRKVQRIATSPQWETAMTNCRIGSSRVVIVPAGHQHMIPWMDLMDIKEGDDLWLQIDVEKILLQGKTRNQSFSRIEKESSGGRIDEGRSVSKKDEITSRLMKMGGQALVPFPSFPSDSAESLDRQQTQSEPPEVSLTSKSLDYVKKSSSNQSSILPPVVPSRQSSPPMTADNIQYPPMIHHLPYIQSESVDRGMMARKESELNMLISEVRTTNSHLCMSIMRMTDKLDNFFSKSATSMKGDSVPDLNQLLTSNNNLKSDMENRFNILANQNQAIMDMLLHQEKSKSEVIGRIESMHDDMMNTILSIVPKGGHSKAEEKDGRSGMVCSETNCQYAREAKSLGLMIKRMEDEKCQLEQQLGSMQTENSASHSKISALEKRLDDLKQETESASTENQKVIDLLKKKVTILEVSPSSVASSLPKNTSSEEPQAERLMTVKLAAAERATELLRKRVKELEIAAESTESQLSADKLATAVKSAMNKAWRALRPVLPNDQLQAEVASALREVTKEFLEQLIVQKTPTESVSSESGRFSPSANLPAIVDNAESSSCSDLNEPTVVIKKDTFLDNKLDGELSLEVPKEIKNNYAITTSNHVNEESSSDVEVDVVNLDEINDMVETDDLTKSERPQELASCVDLGSEESPILSPGDGLIERAPLDVISPGDGFTEKSRPPVPVRPSKVSNFSKSETKDLSSSSNFSFDPFGVKPLPRSRTATTSNLDVLEHRNCVEENQESSDSTLTSAQKFSTVSKRSTNMEEPLFTSRDNSDCSSLKISPSSCEELSKNESGPSSSDSEKSYEPESSNRFKSTQILPSIPPRKSESSLPSLHKNNAASQDALKLSDGNEESADGQTYTVDDRHTSSVDDEWSDDDMDACTNRTDSSVGLPAYAPLVSSEPPPLSPSHSSSSPSPPPDLSCREGDAPSLSGDDQEQPTTYKQIEDWKSYQLMCDANDDPWLYL